MIGGIEHHCFHHVPGRGRLAVDPLSEQITALICEGPTPRRSSRARS